MRVLPIVGFCILLLLVGLVVADRFYGPLGFPSRGQPTDCIVNLKVMHGAKAQFALEHNKTNGVPVTMADIAPYLQSVWHTNCPYGAHYDLQSVGLVPVCSIGT